jgi:DNA replication protein DnaC
MMTQKEYDAYEQQQRRQEMASIIRSSRLPSRHLAFRATDSISEEWDTQLSKLINAIKAGSCMWVLLGDRGTGKTQMATCLCKYLAGRGDTVRYCRRMDFALDLKESFSSHGEDQVIREYVSPKVLVIDEIQVRGDSDWEKNALTNMIDKRYCCGDKVTIFIGNVKEDHVRAELGDTVYDRIIEDGGVVVCDWDSFREGC